MFSRIAIIFAMASLVVAAPAVEDSDFEASSSFDRVFQNQLAATESPSYMSYILVDKISPYSDCRSWCETLAGCKAVNVYLDNYGKGITDRYGRANQYTCSAFSAPIQTCMNTNSGGQDQHGNGHLNKITKSFGYNRKHPSACGAPEAAWDLHHAYSSSLGVHFYTIHPNEIGELNGGYSDEGVMGKIFTNQAPSTTPLFRLYSDEEKDHFYTTSPLEKYYAVANLGYEDDGVAGYVYVTAECGGVPLYHTYNAGHHFYTTEAHEKGFDGVAAYVVAL